MSRNDIEMLLALRLCCPLRTIKAVYVSPGVVSVVIDYKIPSQLVIATLRNCAPMGTLWCVVTTYNPLHTPPMTSKAQGLSYWEFIAAGWDDASMIEYGYMDYITRER